MQRESIFSPDIADIVYASDNKFAEIMGISLVSLFENSKDMKEINVYILDDGISEDNKNKLLSVARKYNRNVIFILATNINQKLKINVQMDRGSLSQYSRLFISSCLPNNVDRVLYLDCDIIIRESIKELWNTDLKGKIIGALMDAFSKYYRINIDLCEDDLMFNSGVMLIDLNKWNEFKTEEKLLNFIIKKNGKIQQGDQGALNSILSKETYCLEPRFNAVTIFFDFSYDEIFKYRGTQYYYDEESVNKAINNPSIVHFTTSFLSKRAWMKGCKHTYANEWFKYKNISAWKDCELWEDKKPLYYILIIKIMEFMPKKIILCLYGLMQIYFRPLKNRFRSKLTDKRK